MPLAELKSTLNKYEQSHLLKFFDDLTESEKSSLLNDIKNLNLNEVTSYFHRALSSNENKQKLDDKVQPIPSEAYETAINNEKLAFYENLGLEEIANGRVAIVLMAGGQGTRLGVDYPKGMYDVGLPSRRSLFNIQALRIRRLEKLANERFEKNGKITWYIMTSDATHEPTLKYFQENNYFGIEEKNIVAFKQSTLPCFTFEGKIILDQKHKISRAPDGNGGLYYALKKEGILTDMSRRSINSIHVFSVDNILVKVADPEFIGYCLSRTSDCGVKVVSKRQPDEAVGVVCLVDNEYSVVEYSEISTKTACLTNETGDLIYKAGNICNHYFTREFLDRLAENHLNELDLHVAKKKIPFVDDDGKRCTPKVPNGIKIEKFVFDVFKFSKSFAVWEIAREDEFSALKNADSSGIDCPSTARNDLLRLHKKWLINAGVKTVEGDVEICPLLSYKGENLEKVAKDKVLKGPILLS